MRNRNKDIKKRSNFLYKYRNYIIAAVIVIAAGFGGSQLLLGPQSWYNVLDYGLKGDSATDNTVALQNLLNFVPAGATIFFPPGKYITTAHVYQGTRAIKWKFANFDVPLNNAETYPVTSAIVNTSNTDTAIIIANTAYGTTFEDAAIVCTSGSSATSTSRGVFFGTAQQARITNSQFLNFGIPVEVKNGGLFIFANSHFYNGTVCNIQLADSLSPDNGDGILNGCTFATLTAASAGMDDIKYISGGGLHVVNCKFNAGASHFAGDCINMDAYTGTVDFFFIGNSCEGFNGRAISANQNGYGLQNAVITNNEFFPQSSAPIIYLDATSTSTGIYNVTIDNNNFSGNGSDTAIYVQGGNTSIYNVSIGLGNTYNSVGRKVVRGSTAIGNTKIFVSYPTTSSTPVVETPSSLKVVMDGSYNFHSVTLTGNDTLFVQDGVPGMFFQVQLVQDATGGRTPLLYTGGTNYLQGSVVPINIFNTSPSASCVVQGMINGTGQLTVYNIASQFTNGSVPFIKNDWLWQDNANLFWDATNKWLCSGCSVPVGPVTSANSTVSSQHNGMQAIWNGSAADPATMDIMKSRGTFGTPTILANSDYMAVLNFWGYDGQAYRRTAGVGTYINAAPANHYLHTDMYFFVDTTSNGTFLYDVYGNNAVAATIKYTTRNWVFGNSHLDSLATIQLPQSSTTNANIKFAQNGADVISPTPGMLWYNSNSHALDFVDNGTTYNLIGMRSGQTSLSSGTKAVTVTGATTSSKAFVTLVSPSGGTATIQYQAVCTTNTVTIQANVAAGTINTSDGSTLNYFVIL